MARVRRLDLLGHPVVAGSLALLVVNDRLLKPWAAAVDGTWSPLVPTVTGKLSDVAGVLLAALVVGIASGRPRASVAAVAVGFSALKVVPGVAVAAAPLLGGVTRADATDLVALPVLVPAFAFLHRRLARPPAGGGRARPSVLGGVVLLLAVPAVAATSCDEPDVVEVLAGDGVLHARIGEPLSSRERKLLAEGGVEGGRSFERWATSTDGGRTWERAEAPPEAVELLADEPAQQGCTADGTCYRITYDTTSERRLLQERHGGVWSPSFAFTDEQWRRMEQRSSDGCGRDVGDGFRSVTAVGDTVVVSMGSQGILRRQGGGAWERVAVLDVEPIRLDGPSWLADLTVAPGVLLGLAPVLVVLALARGARLGRGLLAAGVAVAGAAAGVVVGVASQFLAVDYARSGPMVAALTVVVFIASTVIALGERRRTRGP